MILVSPDIQYKDSFIAAYEEMNANDKFAWIYSGTRFAEEMLYNDFDFYIQQLRDREHTPPQEFVCDTTLWAVDGDTIAGRIGIRHYLTAQLLMRGGHIGFIVRPC